MPIPISLWPAVTRAARKWRGDTIAGETRPPQVPNNEAVASINAAGSGLVDLIKADASNIVTLPNGAVVPAGQSIAFAGPLLQTVTPATLTTAGAETYTAAQVVGGLMLRDPNGANRTDTLPTAALLAAALPNVAIGSTIEFVVRNDADAAETITIAAGTGGTVTGGGTMTIAQSNIKRFYIRFTAVTTPAYIVYSLGTSVF